MENLTHSRHPHRSKKICANAAAAAGRSVYDGAPAKLSPRMEDYSEIFGSFHALRASSIPVLDLPPPLDHSEAFFDVRRSSGFDYAEVFGGGFRGLDFAVSYEDLIDGNSSDEAWSPAEFETMSEESDMSGKDRYFSNGFPQHHPNGNTEFNISYHQAQKMSSEDVTYGTTHVTQLLAVPAYSFMVDSPSQLTEDSVTDNGYLDLDFSAELSKPKAKLKSFNGISGGSSYEHDLRHQKGRGNDCSLNRNSFIEISDINLQTRPSDLPPPSRPPPVVRGEKVDSDKLVPKSDTIDFEGMEGDSSPTFFDVEVDASSSAAISAAAIKDAVEKAQARLKSAKELMEKKKEGLQRSHKSGSKKIMKDKAGETGMKDETVKGSSEREVGRTEFVAREVNKKESKNAFEVPETFHAVELSSSLEMNEKEERQKESWLSSGSYKVVETNEWKEATEFFEIAADELKKDLEQVNSEKIPGLSIQINELGNKENGAMETSEKQNDRKVKIDREDHRVEKSEEKKVKEIPSHNEEHNVIPKEAPEMKDREIKEKLTDEVCEGSDKKVSSTVEQLLEPIEETSEADRSDEETKYSQPTPIASDSDENSEELVTPQACEKAKTTNNEMHFGAVESKNEFVDKNFKVSCTAGNVFMDAAKESLHLDCSVEKTSCEINGKPEVSEELGVFEIENILVGEILKGCGKLPESLEDTELSHLDNLLKKTEEVSSVIEEPYDEQVKSASPKLTQVHVSSTREVKNDSTMQTKVVEEITEVITKMEAAQPTPVEEKLKNQKPVQVNASETTVIKEKVYEEVLTEVEKREKELENERLRKVEEEEREREVKQKNQKSTQQFKASQTTERKEKTSGEGETERKPREEVDNERLRKVDEEKQKNQKSASQANANKATERKEKMPREVESERMENERLRRIEEEREREREREKDRMAVDLATVEARERAFGESRERTERAAVERATAEARQRAMAEARERLEKACAEAREKSLAGKTATEARIRAERAAVERATAEARERAAGKAMADRATFEAKNQVQRSVSDKFSVSSRNSRMRQSSSSSDLHNLQSQGSGVSRFQNSSVYAERHEGVEGESAQRCKARLERHRRTTERAAKALAEKNMRDLLAQREQTERNRVAETLDADVRRWSSGKEGNLRALLSTLQYVLGPDSGWQPIPLTEVITSAAVKKAYRKATLCVHPDKLQQRGASIQQKYLCEKVFDLLKEGWNKFNSEER